MPLILPYAISPLQCGAVLFQRTGKFSDENAILKLKYLEIHKNKPD